MGGAAMILCAGLGSRLRPLTDERSKPMMPVGDAPAVAHVARQIRGAADRIVVNVHHRPEDLEAWANAEGIAVSREPELLGTAGGVARASELLGAGDVLVWNGDILSNLDPGVLRAAHGAGEATLAVRPREAKAGNVGLAADGSIARLRQESFGVEVSGGEFLGIHVLGARLRALLPDVGCLVGDVYLPALRRGERMFALETASSFVDIGTLTQYRAANAAWLTERGLRCWAHPSAEVRASIEGSVVGAGAVVGADAIGCVVWAGARITSACRDVVVTARGVV